MKARKVVREQSRSVSNLVRVRRVLRAALVETLEGRQLLSATYSAAALPGNPLGSVQAFNNAGDVAGSSGESGFLYANGTASTFDSTTGNALTVTAMNATGQVVGDVVQSSGGADEAFRYSGGTFKLLGLFGGSDSDAAAINNSGTIAGNYVTAGGDGHGFVYSSTGVMTDIGTLGGTSTFVMGMNNSGQIVGYSTLADGDTHAFLYSGGKMTDIDPSGGSFSEATAINDNGQIIGNDNTGAFYYSNGTMAYLLLAPGEPSHAAVINASGEVAGDALNALKSDDLFTFSNGVMTDQGSFAGASVDEGSSLNVIGINSSGVILGAYDKTNNPSTPDNSGFFVFTNGAIQDINYDTLGAGALNGTSPTTVQLDDFQGVNDSGQLVASMEGFEGLGLNSVYILSPSTTASVSGTVFHDTNGDGAQQSGETGFAGLVVYDDLDDSNSFTTGDIQATTNASGNYTLSNIPPGPAIIRFLAPTTNWFQSSHALTLAGGQNLSGVNFGTLPVTGFQITDLGQLNGLPTTATAINNAGQIAGFAQANDEYHPFLYTVSTGKYTDLTSILGNNVEINSINDSGQMVGTMLTDNVDETGLSLTSAFVYTGGKMTILPLPAGTDSAAAVGINDTGQIVILATSTPQQDGPYLFDYTYGYVYNAATASLVSKIPQSLTNIDALAINNSGQIFEHAVNPPFKEDPGTGENFLVTGNTLAPLTSSVSAPGPWFGNPVPASLADTLVAYSTIGVSSLGSSPFGANVDLAPSFYTGAQAVNLNDAIPANSNWTIDYADAINSSDLIVGQGINPNGKVDAYLLTPLTAPPPSKPTISGTVFNDTNKDGIQDNGETGAAGVVVYEDPNYNHTPDAGEQTATTDASGNFTFTNLPTDPEILRIVLPSGATQTFPASSGGIFVGANIKSSITGENFGIFSAAAPTGSISGNVFVDANHNGTKDSGEAGVSGTTVYLDLTNAGSFVTGDPTAVTSSTGAYTFPGLSAGSYLVRETTPAGYTQSTPANNAGVSITLSAGQNAVNENFGVNPAVVQNSISGTVFNDANHNGVQDSGELGVAGITVYEDPNYNHKNDTGEQTAVTDASGNFIFTNLPADPEILRLILPSGATQTFPTSGAGQYVGKNTGQTLTGINFGVTMPLVSTASVSGVVFVDVNGNSIQDAGDVGVAGAKVYVDLNNTGGYVAGDPFAMTDSNGNYTINGLPAGPTIIREIPPTGYTQASPASNGSLPVTLSTGQAITGENFTLTAVAPTQASLSGTVFNDLNHNGVQDAGELGVAGITVYEDPNYNRKADAGEQSVVTDANGNYTFTNLPVDPEILRIVLPSGATQTLPASGAGIYVGKNITQAITNLNFGVNIAVTGTASISGTVFNDLNGDHAQSSGELALTGTKVYLDLNQNGIFDAGEPTAITTASGFVFTGLAPGKYIVGLIPDAGFRQTFPVAGGTTVTVTSGKTVSAGVFGETSSAYVGGTLFNDINGNGVQNSGEAGLSGWKVYIDTNNDGVFETGEPVAQTTTTSAGYWYFRSVAPGTYTIRAVAPSGYTITHAYTVTLAGGDMVINGLIGAKKN